MLRKKTYLKLRVKYKHWLPKFLKVGAITLYPYILIKRDKPDVPARLYKHEMVHVNQIRVLGWWKFYWTYLKHYFALRREGFTHDIAYRNIPFEIAAYKTETYMLTPEERKELEI